MIVTGITLLYQWKESFGEEYYFIRLEARSFSDDIGLSFVSCLCCHRISIMAPAILPITLQKSVAAVGQGPPQTPYGPIGL